MRAVLSPTTLTVSRVLTSAKATQLTVVLSRPHSLARVWMTPTMPALAAAQLTGPAVMQLDHIEILRADPVCGGYSSEPGSFVTRP